MTKKISFAAAPAALALALAAFAAPAPAMAATCTYYGSHGPVSGAPNYSYTGAQNGTCVLVQARNFRYIGSSITTTTASSSTTNSVASSTGGYDAGGSARAYVSGQGWGAWTGV